MSRVLTRVIEIDPGEWVVQFEGGLGGWTTFSDTFTTEAEALAFEAEQITSADWRDEE
jgi:fluoride ion exporter CrcB/FEX